MSSSVQAFGKYLLLERLNAGGMAEVFLAKSQGASGITKFVAMKRILPQLSKDTNYIDMFKTEAKVVMNLNHSNVVQIYEFGVEKEQFYLVMEYVEGQNLRQALNQLKKSGKHFSIDQIVYLIKESASGLDHAHRCIDSTTGKLLNIIHRDISPQNIMISFEGEVKIVDFGIAKSESQIEQTRAGTIKGKFAYMSPEQSEGLECDARTDVFSLGIVLWELLSGERLFSSENEHAILKKIKDCIIPSLRKINPLIPVELERIVMTALTKDQTHRYQSAEDFSKDLSKFLNTTYPEFSKQDFSKFMKSLNKDVYLENRKKLAEYAKIEAPPFQETQSITTPSKTAPEVEAAEEPDLPGNLSLNSENSRVDFKALNSVSMPNARKIAIATQTTSQIRPSHTTTGYQIHTGSRGGPGSSAASPRVPLINSQQRKAAEHSSGGYEGFMGFAIFAIIIGGGGWWYLTHKSPQTLQAIYSLIGIQTDGSTVLASKTNSQSSQPGKTEQLAAVKIESTPSGATVYINEKPAGSTPMMTTLPMNTSFKVKVLKDGFMPAESVSEMATTTVYSKNFVLLQEPATGTVTIENIKANPESSHWSVYINGQLVSRTLPFIVKVPSGVLTAVKVVDPISKTEAEESVTLNKGQTKSVSIKPNKPTTVLK